MIRNVTIGRLRAGADPTLIERALAEIVTLKIEGMVSISAGRDLGLRDNTWDMAVVADFVDDAAYLRYDTDEEHDRMRRELFRPACEELARVQYALPDAAL